MPPLTSRRGFIIGTSAVLAAAASRSSTGRTVDLTGLSATEAVAAMRDGEIKAEEYAVALLNQATRLADLNAFRTLRPDEVKAAAREADKRRAAGRSLGLMHGLPIPVKDSVSTKALPTSQGTRALQHFMPKDDAAVLKPLFAQGAILMGKTNLHELSCGWSSNNAAFGPVKNPYDRTRTPGGSSGGSAAAVASHIAPLAIAEDTYGSIRVPATFCGLTGLRPTFGRYPSEGILPLSRGKFDQVGPLARSVSDLVLFDSVMTGERAPVRAPSLKGLRIGISPEYLSAGMEPECERIMGEALRRVESAGAKVVAAELPQVMRDASTVVRTILGYELLNSIATFLKEQGTGLTIDQLSSQVGPNLAPLLEASRKPGKRSTYLWLLRRKEEIKAATIGYFRVNNLEALAFAPVLMPAFAQGDADGVEIGGHQVDLFTAIGRNIGLGSCASLACLVLPSGMTANGLPVGLEFDALPGRDRRLLALGVSLERALGPIPAPAIAA
jgi:indoleacetamide hydrolase